MKALLSFLSDEAISDLLWLYFVAVAIVLVFLKSFVQSTILKPIFFDHLIKVVFIVFLMVTVSHVLLTEKYHCLWNMVFALGVLVLEKVIPKFVKWYDSKIDTLVAKLWTAWHGWYQRGYNTGMMTRIYYVFLTDTNLFLSELGFPICYSLHHNLLNKTKSNGLSQINDYF